MIAAADKGPVKRWPVVWSIAGSDSGAGAGLQADLRAFDAFEVHGCTAVAALTAQNSVAVTEVVPVAPEVLHAQLAALADDLPPRAIKTGLLGSADNVRVVCHWVLRLRERGTVHLVVDPVWRASTGAALADDALRQALRDELLPLATVITPNRREAAWLLGRASAIRDDEVTAAALELRALGAGSVVITGGDDGGGLAQDHVQSPQGEARMTLPRVDTVHHHGTGCVFASTLAAALAHGFCEADATVLAKMATTRALQRARPAGAGAGPVRTAADFAQQGALLPGWHPASGPEPAGAAFAPAAPLGLYAIVDSAQWVERVAKAGVQTVQLRIKEGALHADALEREVAAAVAAARAHGLPLYINDHWQLALRHGAHGVHLGQEDLDRADLAALQSAGLRLGVSTHAVWEVARAVALGPSYVACGPMYPTRAKRMPWRSQGTHNLAHWCRTLGLPVVAIGGLDTERAAEAVRCGAQGIAVLSGITAAPRPEAVVQHYLQAIAQARAKPPHARPMRPRPTLATGVRASGD